ncbi:hypothetical protein evm_015583 [Chilo suppressalis]|nr:hypothetical protein evm_015583 [Chilo suppressalis]
MFHGEPSFTNLYMSPWGALPASLLGVFLAHLHTHLQEIDFQFTEHKVLTCLHRCTSRWCGTLAWGGALACRGPALQRAAAGVPAGRPVMRRPGTGALIMCRPALRAAAGILPVTIVTQ